MKPFAAWAFIVATLFSVVACTPDNGAAGTATNGFPEPSRFQQMDKMQGLHREALQDAY